jgi:hypothetical protein
VQFFAMDLSSLIWQMSLMARSTNRDARDSHHTVSAGVLESFGRGFLIATAGVVAGVMFGTAHLAAMGVWMLGVAAVSGVGCMIGSALVRNAAYDRCDEEAGLSPRVVHIEKEITTRPVAEAAMDTAPEERWVRRVAMSEGQREHGTGIGA